MKYLIVFFLFLNCNYLNAQEQNSTSSSLGIKANIGKSSYLHAGKPTMFKSSSYSAIPAYTFGIQYSKSLLNNNLDVFSDFNLVKRGYEFRYHNRNIDQRGTEQLHYLSLPIGLLLKIRHIHLGGGFGVDYMVNRTTTADGKKYNDSQMLMHVPESNYTIRSFYLLKCGVKFRFKNSDFVFIEFAYDRGFTDELSNFGLGASYNYSLGKKNKAE
jgi:hypothetical protein